jgi:hypothetical protein
MNVTSISTIARRKDPIPLPLTILSKAKETSINWLWEPYIPKAGTTMIVGDGGYGKSYMTYSLAADLSAGRALPGQAALPPQRIVLINAEDGIGPIMLPRIKALGGNLDNIAAYDTGFTVDKSMADRILASVREFDAAVLFLDPMVVYTGGEIDAFKANEVRSIMDRLTTIAREANIAVVGVHHVKKAFSPNAQHKSLGSVDFMNGVRSAVLVDISKSGTYYMKHVKHNWSKAGPTLAYGFTDDKFTWLGEMHLIEDAVDYTVSHTPRSKARAFIRATLKDGPIPSLKFMSLAKAEGFTERTINRAKKGLAFSVEKVDNGVRKWFWELEEKEMPRPETDTGTLEAFAGPQPLTISADLDNEVLEEAKRRLAGIA